MMVGTEVSDGERLPSDASIEQRSSHDVMSGPKLRP